jgi:hypothetical protein
VLQIALLVYLTAALVVAVRFAHYMTTLDRYDWRCKRLEIWSLAATCTLLWPFLLVRPRPFLNPGDFIDPLGLAPITRRIGLNVDQVDREEPWTQAFALSSLVLNELERRLEREGFSRQRGMFFREHGEFTERYYLSGGPGLMAEPNQPYRLHAGLRIEGLPPIPDWKGFGVHVHAVGDAAAIAPGNPILYPVPTRRTAKRVAKDVARAVLATSPKLRDYVPVVRVYAQAGVGTRLPVGAD